MKKILLVFICLIFITPICYAEKQMVKQLYVDCANKTQSMRTVEFNMPSTQELLQAEMDRQVRRLIEEEKVKILEKQAIDKLISDGILKNSTTLNITTK